MSSYLLMTTAVILALSLTAAQAADKTAPGGTGVEQSTEGQGVTNKDTSTMPGESSKAGSPTGMEPGTGVEDSVQGEGATNKQGVNGTKSGQGATNIGGPSSGNAPGGTGVETSSQSEGSKNKTSN